jgi:hypothetical protein
LNPRRAGPRTGRGGGGVTSGYKVKHGNVKRRTVKGGGMKHRREMERKKGTNPWKLRVQVHVYLLVINTFLPIISIAGKSGVYTLFRTPPPPHHKINFSPCREKQIFTPYILFALFCTLKHIFMLLSYIFPFIFPLRHAIPFSLVLSSHCSYFSQNVIGQWIVFSNIQTVYPRENIFQK